MTDWKHSEENIPTDLIIEKDRFQKSDTHF